MPLVIPVFIPHAGCPHACLFCDQHRISGRTDSQPVTPAEVTAIIRQWLARSATRRPESVQVAFYGGSFTGLPEARQEELLETVAPFLTRGEVRTIRISTRPDYVSAQVIARLRRAGVGIVEIGVQSLDPAVLSACNRGHTAEQAIRAMLLLREAGLETGVQLMLGLPGQTLSSLRQTARRVAALRPHFVRIYPALVLQGSGLALLHGRNLYRPLPLDEAVGQAAWLTNYLESRTIRVVRLGLQPGPELEAALEAGPYHPAFGELVRARLMLRTTRRTLRCVAPGSRVRLAIAARDRSIFRGLRGANMVRLQQDGLHDRFELVTDPAQPRGTLRQLAAT